MLDNDICNAGNILVVIMYESVILRVDTFIQSGMDGCCIFYIKEEYRTLSTYTGMEISMYRS